MRYAFIISALAFTICLHISTTGPSPAVRPRQGAVQAAGEVHDAALTLTDINASMQGERITVVGRVSDVWEAETKRAPHTLIVRDGSAALEIVHWLKSPPPVEMGDSVECTGTVDLYRGRLQLRLRSAKDLEVLSP